MTIRAVIDSAPHFTYSGNPSPVDLWTDFDDNDFISIAIPAFPLGQIDLTQSTVSFTANADGTFDSSDNTTSIPFSANINMWVEGDNEFRFTRSLLFPNLTGTARQDALQAVTGVRFNIEAIIACTFRVLAFRLISKNWKWAPLDIDTNYDRLERPASPDGSITGTNAFPSGTANGQSYDWPILLWANDPPGHADPSPIDSSLTAAFHTGSLSMATGEANWGAQFNAPGCVTIGTYGVLGVTGAFTLEAWIHPDDLSHNRAILTRWQDVAGKRGYRWCVTSAGELELQYSTDGTAVTTFTSSGAGITVGHTYHVALTFAPPVAGPASLPLPISGDASAGAASLPLPMSGSTSTTATIVFYVNGAPVSAVSGMPATVYAPSVPFKIGAWNTG